MTIKGVSIFAKRGNKILAVKRNVSDKMFGGMWGLPGGQIEENESVKETATREVFEETGLKLISMDESLCMEGQLNVSGYPPIIIFMYKGEVSNDVPIPHDDDIEKVEWIEREKLITSLRENNYPLDQIENLEKFFDTEGLK
jgi:ADP-ribose pyrophosphatase YjhB (NUDIX family)